MCGCSEEEEEVWVVVIRNPRAKEMYMMCTRRTIISAVDLIILVFVIDVAEILFWLLFIFRCVTDEIMSMSIHN